MPPWVPGAAKRKRFVERLTKLGTVLPGEGEMRYYGFKSYAVSEGMELHGTLDDIFKDAPPSAPPKREDSEEAEEKSELARLADEVRQCQSQLSFCESGLSQLIGLVQGSRGQALAEEAPAANRAWNGASQPALLPSEALGPSEASGRKHRRSSGRARERQAPSSEVERTNERTINGQHKASTALPLEPQAITWHLNVLRSPGELGSPR